MNQDTTSLTSTDYEILSFLAQRPSCLWSDVLNALEPAKQINKVSHCLQILLSRGLIEKLYPAESPPQCRIRLTLDGYHALHLHDVHIRNEQKKQEDNDRMRKEEASAKEAERASDRKFQIRLSLFQVLLSLLVSILSGVVLGNLDRITVLFKHFLDAAASFISHFS